MQKILIAFTAFALLTFSQGAAAASWLETFLVLQTDSGQLAELTYASDSKDEQAGIRRYESYSANKKTKANQCSYRDDDKPRILRCPVLEGKRTNRVYTERRVPADKLRTGAHQIYARFAGNRLSSSVGDLHQEMFECTAECPKGETLLSIWISCAECTMEEEWCDGRLELRPKLATIAVEEANVRAEPAQKSQLVGKLRLNQTVRVLETKSNCSEIETKNDVVVGRWIKVKTNSGSPQVGGWIFDRYATYEGGR